MSALRHAPPDSNRRERRCFQNGRTAPSSTRSNLAGGGPTRASVWRSELMQKLFAPIKGAHNRSQNPNPWHKQTQNRLIAFQTHETKNRIHRTSRQDNRPKLATNNRLGGGGDTLPSNASHDWRKNLPGRSWLNGAGDAEPSSTLRLLHVHSARRVALLLLAKQGLSLNNETSCRGSLAQP